MDFKAGTFFIAFLSCSLFLPFDSSGFNPTPPEDTSSKFTLFLGGNVMTGRGIDQILPESLDSRLYEPFIANANRYIKIAEHKNGKIPKNIDYQYVWGDALDIWQGMDPALKLINLETAITENDEPLAEKGLNYRMHPENTKVLKTAGIDFCHLANNHTIDWQKAGIKETIKSLDQAQIAHGGAGYTEKEAIKPTIFRKSFGRVLIFAFGLPGSGVKRHWKATKEKAGIAYLPKPDQQTLTRVKKIIDSFSRPQDKVFISMHWGKQWGYEIPDYQRNFAHQLIDKAGVDLIYGHSSHHPKGVEVYNDKLILYGAGSMVNDFEGIGGYEKYPRNLSLMYFPKMNAKTGDLEKLSVIPMRLNQFQLHSGTKSDAQKVKTILNLKNSQLGTCFEIKNGVLVYDN